MTVTDYIRSELAEISPEFILWMEYETSEVISWGIYESPVSLQNKQGLSFNCVNIHIFRDFLYAVSQGKIQKPESFNDLFVAYMQYLKVHIDRAIEKQCDKKQVNKT